MSIRTRFAPSPTGYLHIGNARTALINFLAARKNGGEFLLRLDDTDAARSTDEFADAITEDLVWLGLAPDRTERQSDRMESYQAALDRLKDAGLVYDCYETPAELDRRRKVQRAQGKPPVYDRAALELSNAERAALKQEGRAPHWRFRLPDGDAVWIDLVRGESRFALSSLSDPILIREDGSYLYMLPSTVDDIEMGITHVVRGEDHVTNTAVQSCIFTALGGTVPAFAHLPLMTGAGGEGMSKRLGSSALRDMRTDGMEPMAICSLLARLGTSDAVTAEPDMAALSAGFEWAKFSRAPVTFDPVEVASLSARILHDLPFAAVSPRLAAFGLDDAGEPFWNAVRGNLARLEDAAGWWRIVSADIEPVIEDADFTATAAALLPPGPWDHDTWPAWTAALKENTGRKGKALFHPLRLALTGCDAGPDMRNLLPLIGPDRARRRLSGQRKT